jgi:hypothetical protein
MSLKDVRAGTYTGGSGTTKHTPQELVNELYALSVYIKWRNSSSEENERIGNDYSKIPADVIRKTKRGMLFRSSSGEYIYDRNKGKMVLKTQ